MSDPKREATVSVPTLSPIRLAIARYRSAATATYVASVETDSHGPSRNSHASAIDAEQAAAAVRQRLDAVIQLPSGSVQDVLLKLQLWREITGVDDRSQFDLDPPEQTVVSACNDLERLTADPDEWL